MTETATRYPHITAREDGTLVICGTGFKLLQLVQQHNVLGWGAEELSRQHEALSLAQIHSALAYYFDHKEPIDAEIEKKRERTAKLLEELEPQSAELTQRLRAIKAQRAQ